MRGRPLERCRAAATPRCATPTCPSSTSVAASPSGTCPTPTPGAATRTWSTPSSSATSRTAPPLVDQARAPGPRTSRPGARCRCRRSARTRRSRRSGATYFLVTAVLLAPFALLAAWFLAGAHRGRPWDAMAFAAAPALVARRARQLGPHRGRAAWPARFWAWARGRPRPQRCPHRARDRREALPAVPARAPSSSWRCGAASPLDVGVGRGGRRRAPGWSSTCPAMLGDLDGWKTFWQFNSARGRGPRVALAGLACTAGHDVSAHTINVVSWVLFAAGVRGRAGPRPASPSTRRGSRSWRCWCWSGSSWSTRSTPRSTSCGCCRSRCSPGPAGATC